MYPNELRKPNREPINYSINRASQPVNKPPEKSIPEAEPRIEPNQSHNSHQPKKNRAKLKVSILVFLILAVIAAAAYGGYYYANNIDGDSQQSTTSDSEGSNSTGSLSSDGNAKEPNSNIDDTNYVLRVGYPFDLEQKKAFVIKLGLPSEVQAVGVTSSDNSRGQERFYTDKYNDEIGRWHIGYPNLNQSYPSQVSIVAISKSWLKLKQQGNTSFSDTSIKLDTPTQKAAYIKKVEEDSKKCSKEVGKGFSTKDGIFNICYSIIPGKDNFSPVLALEGYGNSENIPMLFVGAIRLDDGKSYSEEESKKLLAEADDGKLPQSTIDLINSFTTALAKTTLKVESSE